jgi:NAD(P)-dependent dehydrogenase (short-subunit alcohol dehydrogenase family)
LVTGANSGIGLATTLHLAGRGWDTWGTVRSKPKAAALRDAASEVGVAERVHPVVLDVSDDKAVGRRWATFPDFYAVVNNAGYSELGAVEEVTAEQARAQLDINLVAPAVVAACALPAMRERGAGRIVMVSSKFGLEALSDVLRMEVAGFGVKVAIVEPGFFRTGIGTDTKARAGERLADDSPYRTAYERTAASVESMERFAPPPDAVARVIASAIESARPLRRYLVGADAVALAATHPFIPRAFTDAATRLLTGLGGPPTTFT